MNSDVKLAAARWIARRDAGWNEVERAEFLRWISADPRHAQALAQYEHAWNMFDLPRQTGQGEMVWNELGARSRRRKRRYATVAVSLALMIATAVLVRTRFTTVEDARSATHAVVLIPERRTLPDGTVVEFRPGAVIELNFAGSQRRVTLAHGEAHFQVVSDPRRPFVVEVGGRIGFRATGTGFAVEVGTGGIALVVTEGEVAVERPDPAVLESDVKPLALVPAGKRVVVKLAGNGEPSLTPVTVVSDTELEELLSWRAPRLEFGGTPLAEAITLMNRYSRVQIALGDPELSRVELSGYFRADNTDAFLRVLEATFGIDAEPSGGTVILRRSR